MSALPLKERLRELATERGISVERTILSAYDPAIRGTSPTFVKKALAGTRRPNRGMLESLARVLRVDPAVFVEYRMLMIRDALDESIDFDSAVETLEAIEAALGDRAAEREEEARRARDELEAELEERAQEGHALDRPSAPAAPSKRGRGRRPRAS